MTKYIMPNEKPSGKVSSCAGCSSNIFDRYYLLVAEKSWHVHCLQCCVCGIKLESEFSCFLRNNLVFCRDDYNRQFPRHCNRCSKLISPTEMVMRVKQYVFHISCFFCVICSSRLQPGDYFGVSADGSLFCRSHCAAAPSHPQSQVDKSNGSQAIDFEHLHPTPLPVAAPVPECGPSTVASTFENVTLLNIENNVCGMGFGGPDDRDDSTLGFNSGHFRSEQHSLMGECSDTLELGHQSTFTASACTPCPSSVSPTSSTLRNTSPGSLDGGSAHSALDVGHQRPNSEMLSMMMMAGANGNNNAANMSRSKRMRTSFKHNQLRVMKHYFSLNANPDAKVLKELAQKTGLTKRVLQVWFQNARAKNRRSLQSKQDLTPNAAINTSPQSSGSQNFHKDDPRAVRHFDEDHFPNNSSCGIRKPQNFTSNDNKNIHQFPINDIGVSASGHFGLNENMEASVNSYATLAACLQHLKRSDSPQFSIDTNAAVDRSKSSDKDFYDDYDRNGDF